MAFITNTLDFFWSSLDLTLQTIIPQRVRKVLGLLQPAFNFTASKFVVIKDWRLGVILRVFQVAILIYILAIIFLNAQYLQTEIPTGVLAPYVSVEGSQTAFFVDQRNQFDQQAYCTNSTAYDFEFNNKTFSDIKCMYSDAASLAHKGQNEFFVTTHTTLEKTVYTIQPDSGTCKPNSPEGFDYIVYVGGTCVYQKNESYFPVLAEAGQLNLAHGFTTSGVGIGGALPETHIRRSGSEEILGSVKEGEELRFTISEWLTMSGIDLDKGMDSQEIGSPDDGQLGSGAYNETFPIVRLSGATIVATIKYYQRRLLPADAPSSWKKSTGKASTRIVAIMELTPLYRWSRRGSDVRHMINGPESPIFVGTAGVSGADGDVAAMQLNLQNYGITFDFTAGGNVGKFNFGALITALITGSVLLNVAQVIVTFVALYGMGLSSLLYLEFMRESVDWRKEYARFAAQALVAGYAFMGYDENSSFKLDRKEIFQTLKLILGQRLGEEQLAALADFVMRQGEEDVKVSKGIFTLDSGQPPASNLISIEEWIGIFTEEKVSLDALERLIDNEYKDQRTRQFLLRAAHGVRMRGLAGDGDEVDGDTHQEDADDADDVDPEILQFQQSAKRRLTQAFLSNTQQQQKGPSGGPDIES